MGLLSKITKPTLKLFRSSEPIEANPLPGRPRLIFVSHEASRTGAPLIILNLIKQFAAMGGLNCETLLHNGGTILDGFRQFGPTDVLNLPRQASDELTRRVSKTVMREKQNLPLVAICNSMESRFIGAALAGLGIPVMSLIHELASSYTVDDFQIVYQSSQKIVFPAEAVRNSANSKVTLPIGKSVVLPQGLLNPEFGQSISAEKAREQIRRELNIPEKSFLVLGCGTLDLRKGIDHFVNVARAVHRQSSTDRPLHFVWVGEGPRWTHSPFHYVRIDLDNSPAKPFVHFIGERANVEPWFVGADAFLMTSRVDPFPCVIHEAMAVGLPILAYAESGGAAEALSDGAGLIVPYADYEQSAAALRLLVDQPNVVRAMREKSKQRVATNYRFSDYAQRIIDLANSIATQHPNASNRIRAAA